MNLWVNWHLCSFVACTITHLYMGNSTAFFTTNNSSEERGTTTRALDTLNTRTDGFLQILLMWCAMSPKLKYSTVRPPVCVLIFGTNLHFSAFKLCCVLRWLVGDCDVENTPEDDAFEAPCDAIAVRNIFTSARLMIHGVCHILWCRP